MILIHLSGRSGSGKTTLAIRIIAALHSRGIRTAFLKNIPHDDVSFDLAGKDTNRAIRSGAALSAGRAVNSTFIEFGSALQLENLIEMTERVCDVCLIEGFHDEIHGVSGYFSLNLELSDNGRERRISITLPDGSVKIFMNAEDCDDAENYIIEKVVESL